MIRDERERAVSGGMALFLERRRDDKAVLRRERYQNLSW